MPVVMDADFNGVWVEEADLVAYLDPNATRPGPSVPAAADADNQDIAIVPQHHPPLSDLEWRNLGFDSAVANALAECGASRADLVTDPPLTVREVLTSFITWIGPSTAAVTAMVALGALDSGRAPIRFWLRPCCDLRSAASRLPTSHHPASR